MNVFRREMRGGARGTLLWCLGMLLLIAASMQKFSALSVDPASMNVLYQMPPAVRDMLGVGALDFTTPLGYYGMVYPYVALLAAAHAAMLGAVILSKEERDHTAEFLYAKPAARGAIMTAKFAAALSQVAVLWLVTGLSSGAMVGFSGALARLIAGLFLTQALFLALGSAAAAAWPDPKAAPGVAAGVLLVLYVLSAVIDITGARGALRLLTPFQYFDARKIVGGGQGLEPGMVALAAGAAAALFACARLRFSRRDLKV